MDIEITRLDGRSFRLSDAGININASDLVFSSIEWEHNLTTLQGTDGVYDDGSNARSRKARLPFYFDVNNHAEFPIKRNLLFGMLHSREPFYIRELRRASYDSYEFEKPGQERVEPANYKLQYANGMRLLVKVNNSYEVEQQLLRGRGEIEFISVKLPYFESVETSSRLNATGLDPANIGESDSWSYGMGLQSDPATWVYSYSNVSQFNIYNPGLPIDSFRMDRRIVFTVNQYASELKLTDATGTLFYILHSFKPGDKLVIDKNRVTVNGYNQLRHTNREFPKILSGQNTYKVQGVTQYTVEFDFRFYYDSPDIDVLDGNITGDFGVIDITPPNAPTINSLTTGSKTISGSAEAMSAVTITFSRTGNVYRTSASATGDFALAIPSGEVLMAGDVIKARATDAAGNISTEASMSVSGYPYTAPIVGPYTKNEEYFTVNNLVVGKGLKIVCNGRSVQITTATNTGHYAYINPTDYNVGDTVTFYIFDSSTGEQLSPSTSITVKAQTSTASLNRWIPADVDYRSTINTGGAKQVTSLLRVLGNPEQVVGVQIKSTGDEMTVEGTYGAELFYVLGDGGLRLKPNTTYTVAYDPYWTNLTPGLHTHAWGVGYLTNDQIGKRQKFTFTTNANGYYGHGQGAQYTPPASYYLNAMHAEVADNIVTYKKITISEGPNDTGWTQSKV